MPFVKGKSGNPKGRPPIGDSLADQIRLAGTPELRAEMLEKMWTLAAKPHDDPRSRIAACEWLARHGWPEEASGKTTVKTDKAGNITVEHTYLP
jgi:hypothetical protein